MFNSLPLDPILLLCSELVPKVSELQASLSPATANTAIMDLLRSANLDQQLPAPPVLSPRRFVVCMFPTSSNLLLNSSLVVGCIDCMVDFFDMG